MAEIAGRLAEYAAAMHLGQLVRSLLYAVAIYTAFVIVVFGLEQRAGGAPGRYATRHFINDIAYTLFYRGGFFSIFVLAGITNALDTRTSFLHLKLLHGLPWPLGLALFWVGADFLFYWLHRLQHSNRFLWAFHSVHHSQTQMTLLTAWRRHPLEILLANVLINIGVFHLVLGVPTRAWMPLGAAMTCLQALQHSQLDWRYGPAGRWVVSPHFHAFHHSVDRHQSEAKFGLMFSCWDYLFGTAVDAPERPARYGADGIEFHESLVNQFMTPFRLAWRWRRAAPASPQASAPHPSAPPT